MSGIINYGIYRGKSLSKVPAKWLLNHVEFDPYVQTSVKEYVDRNFDELRAETRGIKTRFRKTKELV